MAKGKEEIAKIKLQIEAGKATPAPPVGPALGQRGVNIMEFCKAFNARTQAELGSVVPVVITVYKDKTFSFVTKVPPVSDLLKKVAGIIKGSASPLKEKVASINDAQVTEVAKKKLPDLNAMDLDGAKNIVKGTARSMGIRVVE